MKYIRVGALADVMLEKYSDGIVTFAFGGFEIEKFGHE
jgi:hypothetical protein